MSIKNNALTGENGKGKTIGESMPDKDIKITPQFDPEILQEVEAAEPITPAEVMAETDTLAKPIKCEITGKDLLLRKVESIPCLVEPFLQFKR